MRTFIYIILISVVAFAIQCNDLKGKSTTSGETVDVNETEKKLKGHISNQASDYSDIVNDIGVMSGELNKSKIIEDFVFEAKYQPHLLLALINQDSLDPKKKINKTVLNKANDYNKLHYIKFSMENKKFNSELLRYKVETADEYAQRISYFSFYVKNDVYLIENSTDTIRGAFVNFERTFDMSPKLNMTFVFERKKTTALNNLTFVFNDVVFNNGKLIFEFDYKKFSYLNSPEIKKIIL